MLLISLIVAAAIAHPAAAESAADPSADARQLLLQGKYAEAGELYSKLAAEKPVVAAIGQARALAAIGKTDEAEKLLAAAVKTHDSAGELRAELALLALADGDLKEAREQTDAALKLIPDGPAQAPARWVAAELDRRAGKLDEATARLQMVRRSLQPRRRDQGSRRASVHRPRRRAICPLEAAQRSVQFSGQRALSRLAQTRAGLLAGALRIGPALRRKVQRSRRGARIQSRAGAESASRRSSCRNRLAGHRKLRSGRGRKLAQAGPGNQPPAALGPSASGRRSSGEFRIGPGDRIVASGRETRSDERSDAGPIGGRLCRARWKSCRQETASRLAPRPFDRRSDGPQPALRRVFRSAGGWARPFAALSRRRSLSIAKPSIGCRN